MKTRRAKRAKIFAEGAVTGRQIVPWRSLGSEEADGLGSLPKRHYMGAPGLVERFAIRGPEPATRWMP